MELIKQIASEIKKHNGRAFLVGGYVRDKFLGIKSKDYDLEVFKIRPKHLIEILKKFGDVNIVGEDFGVIKLNNEIDISLPRRERKTGLSHKDFDISCDPYMTYSEAAMRRDLTINSMMLDPLTNEIIDCYNGLHDLKNKTIRFIDKKRFQEDPLRVLRVAQFAARLNFVPDISTSWLCHTLIHDLKFLSRERVFTELEKILLKADKPSIAFRWMYKYGILKALLPEIHEQARIKQGRKHHPEGVVFEHCMLAIDALPIEKRTLPLMLAILFHDIGKTVVKSTKAEDGADHFHFRGHEVAGAELAKSCIKRLTSEKSLLDDVYPLILYHMIPHQLKNCMRKKIIRRLAIKVNIPDLLLLHTADKCARDLVPDIEYVDKLEKLYDEIKNEIKPLIMGRHLIDDLKMTPSKEFGIILNKLYEKQLDGEFNNVADGLSLVKRYSTEKLLEYWGVI
jgi:tRNA nucleotidyltransferase (CCA-adding enzyme)